METKGNLQLASEYLTSTVNQKSYHIGHFEAPSLETLRLKCERACSNAEDSRSEGPPNRIILFLGAGAGLGLDPGGDVVSTSPPPSPPSPGGSCWKIE